MVSIKRGPLSRGALLVLSGALLLGAGGERLQFCSLSGGIRVERTAGGLRVEYLEGKGYPFVLRGWALRSARPRGEGVCIGLLRRPLAPGQRKNVLRARDEVFETGGPFQEKIIYRRSERVIELGGERVSVESLEILPRPKDAERTGGKKSGKEPK
ncbi:MAG: hypothetical protein O2807_04800 [bacterium]|nr:hypothetical protein [bacterium]